MVKLRPPMMGLLLVAVLCGGCGGPEPEPSQTSARPPAMPSPSGTAVVVGPDSVAGWWDGDGWVSADDGPSEVPVTGGEIYSLIRLDEPITTAEGSAATEGCETNPGTSRIEIPGLDRVFRNDDPPPLALSGVAEPRPRPVETLDPQGPVYREAAAELLRERGVTTPAEVVQVLRSDLDGDGKVEVVVAAERLTDKESLFAQPGDYSIVFVRRVVDENVDTTVISESIPRFGADETPFINSQRVSALADLNGDGRMEVAVSGRYYEGAGMVFYELEEDGTFNEVLRSGCGA